MYELLNRFHPIDPALFETYRAHWNPVSFGRKEVITREGQTERYMYFVEEGVQRSYYIKDGKEHVIAFTYPPSFSGIPESMLTQTPARYFLETITPSRMLRIPYVRQQELLAQHRELDTLFRKAAEWLAAGLLERQYELLSHTMEERFEVFMKRSAHLLQIVPHKHLASYLRMDPTNFSKLLNSHPI